MYELKIDKNQTISNVQAIFNEIYHYLKIELFSVPHDIGKPTSKKYMFASDKRISELPGVKAKSGTINFSDETTVADFEKDFKKKFGLNAMLFRKSGRIWLEITNTDSWTLKQQNEEGKSLETGTYLENENPEDHDMY